MYQEIHNSVKKMVTQLNTMAQLEQTLSSQLSLVGQYQPELTHEFAYNGEAQRVASLSSGSYAGQFAALFYSSFHEA